MTKNGHTGVEVNGVLDLGRDIGGRTGALGNDDHVMGEAVEPRLPDLFDHVPLKIDGFLGNQDSGRAHRETDIHGEIPGVPPHDFHDGAALVGLHGVPQLIDALNGGVGGGIEADAVVGAGDIVVDGTGNADDVDAVLAQRLSAPEGAVAADGNDAVQSQELAGGHRPALAFLGHKFLTAGSVQNGTAPIDRMGNALFIQTNDIAGDETVPAPADTVAFQSVIQRSTDDRTDTRVHARRVSAGSQHTDSLYAHNDSS